MDYTTLAKQLDEIMLKAVKDSTSNIDTTQIPWTLRAMLSFYSQNYDLDPTIFRTDSYLSKRYFDKLLQIRDEFSRIGDETYPLPAQHFTARNQPLVGQATLVSASTGSANRYGHHGDK